MSSVIAIDLGGTKTAVAVFDADGRILDRSVMPTARVGPDETLSRIAGHAAALDGHQTAVAVAMALPAIVGPDGTIAWAAPAVAGWEGTSLTDLLASSFGLPAGALFDGYAATLGEARYGAGRGFDSLVTLIIGTGFGAGVWLDGRVLEGRSAVAGAVGWDRWPLADGTLSDPAETVASGSGILALARRLGPETGYTDTRAVFERAASGDTAARSAVDQAVAVAGTVAGHIIDLLAPELVVWSGGVGSRRDFSDRATAVARQSCQPYAASRTQFTRSKLGAESSLAGAAARALSIAEGEVRR